MCFSAPVSFAVATGTGLAGALTLPKVSNWREVPLASVPLVFAVQQSIEGVLWLLLAGDGDSVLAGPLANIFMVFALVIWPAWAPMAIGLVERDRRRQPALAVLFALAILVAGFNLSEISLHPYGVCILQHSLSYTNGENSSRLEFGAYAICTCCPFLFSSNKVLRLFGAIIAVGLAVSTYFYLATYVSVWCFFAAAGSVTIYLYFVARRKQIVERRAA